MIRRPPRSTLFPYTNALPISADEREAGRRAILNFGFDLDRAPHQDRKSTRLNSSHSQISYAVFCLKKKKKQELALYIHLHTYSITTACDRGQARMIHI